MASIKLAANPDRLTRYTVEKTAREVIPSFFVYVVLWPLLMAGGGALIGTSAGIAINTVVTYRMTGSDPLPSEIILYTKYFGYAFFGLFFIFSLLRQVRQWEGMVTEFEEQEYQPQERMQSVVRPMPTPIEQRTTVTPGRPECFPATMRGVDELYRVLIANNWKFTRDVASQATLPGGAKVFPNITANWGAIIAEWERIGYADGGAITDDGQYWIESNCLPGTVE